MTFFLRTNSGVPPSQQLVQQVKHALRLGNLQPGEQLPLVREVVVALTINPNTVLKAYRELELEGLIATRPGVGTFVVRSLITITPEAITQLRRSLMRWLNEAQAAGMDEESINALLQTTLQDTFHVKEEAG